MSGGSAWQKTEMSDSHSQYVTLGALHAASFTVYGRQPSAICALKLNARAHAVG